MLKSSSIHADVAIPCFGTTPPTPNIYKSRRMPFQEHLYRPQPPRLHPHSSTTCANFQLPTLCVDHSLTHTARHSSPCHNKKTTAVKVFNCSISKAYTIWKVALLLALQPADSPTAWIESDKMKRDYSQNYSLIFLYQNARGSQTTCFWGVITTTAYCSSSLLSLLQELLRSFQTAL